MVEGVLTREECAAICSKVCADLCRFVQQSVQRNLLVLSGLTLHTKLTAGSGPQMLSGRFSLFLLQSCFFYCLTKIGQPEERGEITFYIVATFLGGQFVQFNWT